MRTDYSYQDDTLVDESELVYTQAEHDLWYSLSKECYQKVSEHGYQRCKDGIEFLGLVSNRIPSFEYLNSRLGQLGWRVKPVRGLISPIVFFNCLSNRILPVAVNMRALELKDYSPDPDIFHEAFGHACMLIDSDLSNALQKFGEMSLKAFGLPSDEAYFDHVSELAKKKSLVNEGKFNFNINKISEAVQLSRMGWWTFECGLIGTVAQPKAFGAALLSSPKEMVNALSSNLINISESCSLLEYDPTELQSNYFLMSDKSELLNLLDSLTASFSFRVGGVAALENAVNSKSTSIIELESGTSLLGVITGFIVIDKNIKEIIFSSSYALKNCGDDKFEDSYNKSYVLKLGDKVISAYPAFERNLCKII